MKPIYRINKTWRDLSLLLKTKSLVLRRGVEMIQTMVWKPWLLIDFSPWLYDRAALAFLYCWGQKWEGNCMQYLSCGWDICSQTTFQQPKCQRCNLRTFIRSASYKQFVFNGSNGTSVFIYVAYYNSNWVISLWPQWNTVEWFRLLPKWIRYHDPSRLTH